MLNTLLTITGIWPITAVTNWMTDRDELLAAVSTPVFIARTVAVFIPVGFLRAIIAVTRLWPGASLFLAAEVVAVVEGVCGAVIFVVSFKAFTRPIFVTFSVLDALPAVLGA